VNEREAFLRRFHAARPGITSAALAGKRAGAAGDSYDVLAAAVPRGGRVLDLACGDAYLLGKLGPGAVGVDLAAAPGVVVGRAQALPFADRSFAACVCHLAFMLFDDLEAVVGELRRVVVPGGTFAAMLGGGPTAVAHDDDAFHRFLAIAAPGGMRFGDRRAASEAGWRELFGGAPQFARLEVDLSGPFAEVWRFLGASYQLADPPRVRDQLAAHYGDRRVPCRVVLWLATIRL
jgi:SAM-dependent methyltransferase